MDSFFFLAADFGLAAFIWWQHTRIVRLEVRQNRMYHNLRAKEALTVKPSNKPKAKDGRGKPITKKD